MKEIPGAVLNAVKNLEPTLQEVFKKAFEGKDLTRGELEDFKKTVGDDLQIRKKEKLRK